MKKKKADTRKKAIHAAKSARIVETIEDDKVVSSCPHCGSRNITSSISSDYDEKTKHIRFFHICPDCEDGYFRLVHITKIGIKKTPEDLMRSVEEGVE